MKNKIRHTINRNSINTTNRRIVISLFCFFLLVLFNSCKTYYYGYNIYELNSDFTESFRLEQCEKKLKEYELYSKNKKLYPKFIFIRDREKYFQLDSVSVDYDSKQIKGVIRTINMTTYFKYNEYCQRPYKTSYYTNEHEKQYAIGQTHIYIEPDSLIEGSKNIPFSKIRLIEDYRVNNKKNFKRYALPYIIGFGAGFILTLNIISGMPL